MRLRRCCRLLGGDNLDSFRLLVVLFRSRLSVSGLSQSWTISRKENTHVHSLFPLILLSSTTYLGGYPFIIASYFISFDAKEEIHSTSNPHSMFIQTTLIHSSISGVFSVPSLVK